MFNVNKHKLTCSCDGCRSMVGNAFSIFEVRGWNVNLEVNDDSPLHLTYDDFMLFCANPNFSVAFCSPDLMDLKDIYYIVTFAY